MPRKVSISCRTKSGAKSRSKKCHRTGCYTKTTTTCAPRRGADGRFKSGKTTAYGMGGLAGLAKRRRARKSSRSKR